MTLQIDKPYQQLKAGREKEPKRKITLSELFCGAGGMALGAHNTRYKDYGFQHIWATDYDKDACNTFRHNLPDTEIICEDIRSFNFKKMPRTDGLLFGFPCNDFSNVGKQVGTKGNFGNLYQYCVQALKELKPLFFVAENVGGLRSSNGKKDFSHILNELSQAGYNLIPHYYKFEEYGVPQNRHRIIIVGFQKSTNIIFDHVKSSAKKVSAKEALANISSSAPNQEPTQHSNAVIERLKHIKEGENAFTANIPKHLQLNIKGAKISMIYKRLKENEPSYTITGSGGGGTHTYHWSENRALTNRERARLQTFPDTFEFLGGKESVRKQIGMAVPPKGVEVVFKEILKSIDRHGLIKN